MDTMPSFVSRNRLNNIRLCIEQVWEQLCRLKPTKSCGLDNIHPRVLREVKEGVVLPLYLISGNLSVLVFCLHLGRRPILPHCIRKVIDVCQIIILQLVSLQWYVKC